MLIASLSLVAFPFMTGFYSKDLILESAYGQFHFSSTVVYIIATIGAMFTTLYSVKVLYLTFLTNPNGPLINYTVLIPGSPPFNRYYRDVEQLVDKPFYNEEAHVQMHISLALGLIDIFMSPLSASYYINRNHKRAHEGGFFMSLPARWCGKSLAWVKLPNSGKLLKLKKAFTKEIY